MTEVRIRQGYVRTRYILVQYMYCRYPVIFKKLHLRISNTFFYSRWLWQVASVAWCCMQQVRCSFTFFIILPPCGMACAHPKRRLWQPWRNEHSACRFEKQWLHMAAQLLFHPFSLPGFSLSVPSISNSKSSSSANGRCAGSWAEANCSNGATSQHPSLHNSLPRRWHERSEAG